MEFEKSGKRNGVGTLIIKKHLDKMESLSYGTWKMQGNYEKIWN